jgi:hypothetical protein
VLRASRIESLNDTVDLPLMSQFLIKCVFLKTNMKIYRTLFY